MLDIVFFLKKKKKRGGEFGFGMSFLSADESYLVGIMGYYRNKLWHFSCISMYDRQFITISNQCCIHRT